MPAFLRRTPHALLVGCDLVLLRVKLTFHLFTLLSHHLRCRDAAMRGRALGIEFHMDRIGPVVALSLANATFSELMCISLNSKLYLRLTPWRCPICEKSADQVVQTVKTERRPKFKQNQLPRYQLSVRHH